MPTLQLSKGPDLHQFRFRDFGAAVAASALLAACAQGDAISAPPLPPATSAACGADMLGDWAGAVATDEAVAQIRAWRGAGTVRVLGPNAVATMDFRPDRLNVEVDANMVIKGFRCG